MVESGSGEKFPTPANKAQIRNPVFLEADWRELPNFHEYKIFYQIVFLGVIWFVLNASSLVLQIFYEHIYFSKVFFSVWSHTKCKDPAASVEWWTKLGLGIVLIHCFLQMGGTTARFRIRIRILLCLCKVVPINKDKILKMELLHIFR